METSGVWIIELAELDSLSRAEVSTVKAFISRRHDRFRPPYGKRLVDLPRQCVFAGSVNPEGGYLKDATGGRRFWPVVCGEIDIEALSGTATSSGLKPMFGLSGATPGGWVTRALWTMPPKNRPTATRATLGRNPSGTGWPNPST